MANIYGNYLQVVTKDTLENQVGLGICMARFASHCGIIDAHPKQRRFQLPLQLSAKCLGGQNQKWPTSGQGGYITPATWGVPTASERGAESEVAHKWARWQGDVAFPPYCGLLRWAYVDGTGGLIWHKSRCFVISTLTRRHQVAPIALAIAATESKLAVRFVFSSVKKAFYDEFQFEWDLDFAHGPWKDNRYSSKTTNAATNGVCVTLSDHTCPYVA